MKLLKWIGVVVLIVLAGLQFIPTKSNQGKELTSTDFQLIYKVPINVQQILIKSCYDCHSNNTKYPWYSRFQPIGSFLEGHIFKGKEELNFSEFGSYSVRKQKGKLESIINQVRKGEMPLSSYLFIHHDARLSPDNKKVFVDYLVFLQDSLEH